MNAEASSAAAGIVHGGLTESSAAGQRLISLVSCCTAIWTPVLYGRFPQARNYLHAGRPVDFAQQIKSGTAKPRESGNSFLKALQGRSGERLRFFQAGSLVFHPTYADAQERVAAQHIEGASEGGAYPIGFIA